MNSNLKKVTKILLKFVVSGTESEKDFENWTIKHSICESRAEARRIYQQLKNEGGGDDEISSNKNSGE